MTWSEMKRLANNRRAATGIYGDDDDDITLQLRYGDK
jgi:hypothetical protein